MGRGWDTIVGAGRRRKLPKQSPPHVIHVDPPRRRRGGHTSRVVLTTRRNCHGGGKDLEDGDALLRWRKASDKPVTITLMPEAALGISAWFS